MDSRDWLKIKYFKPNEETPWGDAQAFGDSTKMNLFLMMELDAFRRWLGMPIGIHCGYDTDGHVPNSDHSLGRAIDCSCAKLDVWQFWACASRFKFNAIGVYPHWNNSGLHLGIRDLGILEPRRQWGRDANGIYHPF